jgi:glycerol-3-phosphate acyltransferase PlsY
MMTATLFIIAAYLIGSISFAVVVSKLSGLPDPHNYGSGNPGATNVLRTGNKSAALFTLLGDAAKGWLAVWIALKFAGEYELTTTNIAIIAIAVFLGHLYPIFHSFRGGKGVATALGVLLALNPWMGLCVFATWIIVFLFTRISSLAALIAAIASPFISLYFLGYSPIFIAIVVMSLLLIWRHRKNIYNLRSGSEGQVGKGRV